MTSLKKIEIFASNERQILYLIFALGLHHISKKWLSRIFFLSLKNSLRYTKENWKYTATFIIPMTTWFQSLTLKVLNENIRYKYHCSSLLFLLIISLYFNSTSIINGPSLKDFHFHDLHHNSSKKPAENKEENQRWKIK